MVPCASLPWPMNPLQGSGVSERSRCGAVRILAVADEPSTRDRACRSALAVVPCPSLSSPMNPLQGSGVSERSRCGAVPILELADEHVGAHQGLEASVGADRCVSACAWVRKPAPAMASSISVWVRELVQYCRKVAVSWESSSVRG